MIGRGVFIFPGETFTVEVAPEGLVSGTFSASAGLIHTG